MLCYQILCLVPCNQNFRGRNCQDFQLRFILLRSRKLFITPLAMFLQRLLTDVSRLEVPSELIFNLVLCIGNLTNCGFLRVYVVMFYLETFCFHPKCVFVTSIKVSIESIPIVEKCPVNKLSNNAYHFSQGKSNWPKLPKPENICGFCD